MFAIDCEGREALDVSTSWTVSDADWQSRQTSDYYS